MLRSSDCEYRHDCNEERYRTSHVHELVGSVQVESPNCECEYHAHRFATVSGEAEYKQGIRGHVHKVEFDTDTYEGHEHEFTGYTGGAIDVGCDRHVHVLRGITESERQHRHKFLASTLIEDPTGDVK